jgi:two-component system CheB/CheR fusion protein
VRDRPPDSPIRAWIPGCSTGEEAYTMLSSARAGQYPSSIAIDVGEKRLERFFEMQEDTY